MEWEPELQVTWQESWQVAVAVLLVRQLLLPRPLQELMFYIKWMIAGGTLAACCILYIPLFCLQAKSENNGKYVAFTLRKITRLLGVTWEFRGKQEIVEDGRECIIVANHQSNLDLLGMSFFWNEMVFKIVTKRVVLYMGPIGWGAWLAGMAFIESYADLVKAAEDVKKRKSKLWIFPEGRMNKQGGALLPFKKGAFRLAVSCQLPILPVVFSPYYFLDERRHVFDTGNVIATVLPLIPTDGLTMSNVDDLTEKTKSIMQEIYKATYKEILADKKHSIRYNKFTHSKRLHGEFL